MKLKLEAQNERSILTVTEKLSAKDVPILKAGLSKIISSGKRTLVLDLSSLAEADYETKEALHGAGTLQSWAVEQGALLVVVSPIAGVGGAATLAEGIAKLDSPMSRLTALEAELKAKLKKLEAEKNQINSQLGGAAGDEAKTLFREHSDLLLEIQELELLLGPQFRGRTPLFASEPLEHKSKELDRILDSVLKKEGVL